MNNREILARVFAECVEAIATAIVDDRTLDHGPNRVAHRQASPHGVAPAIPTSHLFQDVGKRRKIL